MTEDRLVSLIIKRLTGELSSAEAAELEGWALEDPGNRQFLARNEGLLEREVERWKSIDPAEGYEKWLHYRKTRRRATILRVTAWTAAASLAGVLIIGAWLRRWHSQEGVVRPVSTNEMVLPGRNTAILTLGNGQRVLLDSTANGELTVQGNTRVVKPDSGILSYEASNKRGAEDIVYNILTTSRKAQYQVRLPDGSHVWLNNVSSLKYPTTFAGKDRTVELSGEAYFEIAPDADRPFIVRVGDESVQVLGTSFNIMSYAEEGDIQTTLVTGAVKVSAGNREVRLNPNEQSQLDASGELSVIKDVASQDIISWKNGFFSFGQAAKFDAVMRQLARWYDIQVVYEGKAPEMDFSGKIDRDLTLNEVLKYFNENQIHLRLEGRQLIVLP